jgi:hypothetical protein
MVYGNICTKLLVPLALLAFLPEPWLIYSALRVLMEAVASSCYFNDSYLFLLCYSFFFFLNSMYLTFLLAHSSITALKKNKANPVTGLGDL